MGKFQVAHHPIMLANISESDLAAIGAKTTAEFSEKFSALLKDYNHLKSMADNTPAPDLSAVIKRIDALEARPQLTEARVSELIASGISTGVPTVMTAWAGSVDGKKLIGAEASRITAEAMAATGTVPVKQAPAPAANATAKDLITAGKYEEAWAASPELQGEFSNPKVYAAYAKAESEGRVNTK